MNEENDNLKKLWRLMNSTGWTLTESKNYFDDNIKNEKL